jgi:hypothetical protein
MKTIDPRNDLAEHTFLSKYARFLPTEGRYETYDEACKRVVDMHRTKYLAWDSGVDFEGRMKLSKALDEIEVALKAKKILGSQRAMQFGGKAILDKNIRQYSCSYTFLDRPEAFSEIFWLSLCGCGYGGSIQKHHVDKLPTLKRPQSSYKHVIEDSIEGWADAVHALVSAFFYCTSMPRFDYSQIRPEGAPLSSSSATAPGPKALRHQLNLAKKHLLKCLKRSPKMRPIDVLDLLLIVLESVRAGGIRRVAGIILFDKDDMAVAHAKTGAWLKKTPHRRLSNNSFMLVRNDCTIEEFKKAMEPTRFMGEPGIFLSKSKEHGTNACQPGFATVLTKKGIEEFDDINIGSVIWSKDGWVNVVNKQKTGTRRVYEYTTSPSTSFIGTHDHKVIQKGERIEVARAWYIDSFPNRESTETVPWSILRTDFLGVFDVYEITVDGPSHTYWTNGCDVSNCAEIGLEPTLHDTGETSISFCNLTTVNVAACETDLEFAEMCRLASILGTLQAGYMDVGYLNKHSSAHRRVLERDALLGVSLTGMADNPDIAFDELLLQEGVEVCRKANAECAEIIGINHAARITCVKPEGTGSLVVKASNGIHPHHSRRYIRHVEGGREDLPINVFLKSQIPEMVVPSAYKKGEVCLRFPIDLGEGHLWLKKDTPALKHLDLVKRVQQSWVVPGTNRGDLTHNVSNTIQVQPHEWDDVEDYIFHNRESFAGVSLLGASGDLDYPQCPFVEILDDDEIEVKYGNDPERKAKAKEYQVEFERLTTAWYSAGGIDWSKFRTDENNEAGAEVVACAGGACLT